MTKSQWSRRHALRAGLAGWLGVSSSGWLPLLADQLQSSQRQRRQCILLWMSGGPSQIDTFDMKPDHENGGTIKEIATSTPGLRFSEHLSGLANHSEQLSIVRSVSTREGDHQRGTYLMRTGQRPGTPVRYPCIGSSLAKALQMQELALPNYLSINPVAQINPAAFSPGFLGPRFAPALVGSDGPTSPTDDGFARLELESLHRPADVDADDALRRKQFWDGLQADFLADRSSPASVAHDTVYRRALAMMKSKDVQAFDLGDEPSTLRENYGRGAFGQGCLLARRLIERGVPIVEVTLGSGLGWDTHQDNFRTVTQLSRELDQGFATLLADLNDRGLLSTTTILWMGEFGRTPQVNAMSGRDHFPNAWTCVFAGGGIRGGQAFGATSHDGSEVVDGKVDQGDVLATLCQALTVDPQHEHVAPDGRPHKIAEGHPIQAILA